MLIKFVRHGETKSNIGEIDPSQTGDFRVKLTEKGHQQAIEVGNIIGEDFITNALVYCSPFIRTRETTDGILLGAKVDKNKIKIFEDPRLREVDSGYVNRNEQTELRRRHGWFYFRFQFGESPADCYDRFSNFSESFWRQIKRKKAHSALIVTHSLTIRCAVMRLLHLSVEQFEEIDGPENCAIITVGHRDKLESEPNYVSGKWGVTGLFKRQDS